MSLGKYRVGRVVDVNDPEMLNDNQRHPNALGSSFLALYVAAARYFFLALYVAAAQYFFLALYVSAAQCLRAFNLLRQAKITLGFNASTDLNEMTEETIHKHFMEKLQLVSGPARIEVIMSELSG